MVGLGETYFAAFLLALGAGEVSAGLVATVPLLGGGVLQLLTPWAVDRLRSRKRWVVICAAVQTLSFLPLIFLAWVGTAPVLLVYAIATVYWGMGMAAGPAWSSWIGTIVRAPIRPHYFARRSLATQIGTASALFLGGAVIQTAAGRGQEALGFAVIFTIAMLARGYSSMLLARQDELQIRVVDRRIGMKDLVTRLRSRGEGRFLLVLIAMTTSVTIASPFFTPFMLEELDLTYMGYVGLIGTAFLARILALSWLGPFVRRLGPTRVLRLGAAGIIPLSALWIVWDNYVYLFVLQIWSGTVWAMYELAAFLLFFEAIDEEERTSLLTLYNLANTSALVLGSGLGALLLSAAPPGSAGYHWVFGASSVCRLIICLALLRLGFGRVTQVAEGLKEVATALRTMAVRPSSGGWSLPTVIRPRRREDAGGPGRSRNP